MEVRSNIVAYCKRNIGCEYDYTPSGGYVLTPIENEGE